MVALVVIGKVQHYNINNKSLTFCSVQLKKKKRIPRILRGMTVLPSIAISYLRRRFFTAGIADMPLLASDPTSMANAS